MGARARACSHGLLRALLPALLLALLAAPSRGQLAPSITSLGFISNGDLEVFVNIPPGFRHGVLEVIPQGADPTIWQPMVSGPLTGAAGDVRFTLPKQGNYAIVRAAFGSSTVVPPTAYTGLDHLSAAYSDGGFYLPESAKTLHILNRVTYGPGPLDFNKVETMGAAAFLDEQLAPQSIDESGNLALKTRVDDLFYTYLPYGGSPLLSPGDSCRFFRGTSEPTPGAGGEATLDWAQPAFVDTGWETGITGLGYGDNDDATELTDMRFISGVQPGYLSVYLRQSFEVPDLGAIDNLLLRMRYDDAFVAYLNGTEVARSPNISASPPAFDSPADTGGGNVDNSSLQFEWDLNSFKPLLVQGTNTLAVQMHNIGVTSSDSSIIPELVSVSATPYPAIKGVKELQHLLHVRGVYSQKQLQGILAEFWENHFTTDYDKVADTLEDLVASGVEGVSSELQAETEAAALEYEEYQFFYDNALGDFGDMLLFSATSPTMLIYLDNILNLANAPNENYSREILELHTRGPDNGYTQLDLEVLARCFTGWTIRKVKPLDKSPFPFSARTPPITPSLTVQSDTAFVDTGAIWQFFRGTVEPTPGPGGEATIDWTQPAFPATGWESGATGIGYGDNDDATILSDMRYIPDPVDPGNNPPVQPGYASVYARHEFAVTAGNYDALVLEIDCDDGFVAYLNGTEIARSSSMSNAGTPPAFDELSGNHEAGEPAAINLAPFAGLMNDAPATNVLAIQVHNGTLGSSDLSLIPRVLGRTYTPDSVEESDPAAVWTFRFNPGEHDTGEKILFDGALEQITIPAGRTGVDAVNDAIDVIDALAGHRLTAEFVCVKLVNKFVSDEISLDTYQSRAAPEWLLTMMDEAVAAWLGTVPRGDIGAVMQSILDPVDQLSGFWLEGANQSKIKTPIEFINSGFRALEAHLASKDLPDRTEEMGMELFRRDEPDGYAEKGVEWVDTLGLLSRTRFNQGLGKSEPYSAADWDIDATLTANNIQTPEELIDYFDNLLFSNRLPEIRRAVFLDFANTIASVDGNGTVTYSSSPFGSLSPAQKITRLRELTGLILSTPEFQFQ